MGMLVKIVLFCLVVVVGFAGYTTFGLPLIIPEPPPVEEKLSGDITMEQYLAIGKKIFDGKGTCTLCHNPVGGRAPVLAPVAQVASERLVDAKYKGEAKTVQEYLYESMVQPSVFVVPGFGKKGSNDTISPMPDVSKGAIGLSEVEMNAVIGYLQQWAGVDVTISLPTGEADVGADEEEEQEIIVAESAEEALAKFECSMCHTHTKIDEGGDIGPDLTALAKTAGSRVKGVSAEQFLMESIVNPNAVIADGFDEDTMPDDYAVRMTISELNLIINAILEKE